MILSAVEKQDGEEAKIIARHHVKRFSHLMAEQQLRSGVNEANKG
jgi:hypothetical protein